MKRALQTMTNCLASTEFCDVKIQATGLLKLAVLCLLLWVLPSAANPLNVAESIAECKQLEDRDPAAAIVLGKDLLAKIDRQKEPFHFGHVLGCLGWSYASLNDQEAARTAALDAEQLVVDLGEASIDSIQIGRRAGSIFHRLGDRISAVENYNLALQQAVKLEVVSEQIAGLANLGVLNAELREEEQAIDNFYQALRLMKEAKDFKYQPPVLFNLAATLGGKKRFKEALSVYQQVAAMIDDQWPPFRVSQTFHGLAAAHSELGHLSLAREYAEKGLQLLIENNHINIAYYHLKSLLANIYAQQGEAALATEYVNEAAEYYLNPQHKTEILGSTQPLFLMAATYERLGLLAQAIQMHKAGQEFEQELQATFNKEVMVQMQVRLQDSQEREAVALLKSERINNQANNQVRLAEIEYQRKMWLLVSVTALVIFLLFMFWQLLVNRKLKRMAKTDPLTQTGNRRAIMDWMAAHTVPNQDRCRLLWLIDLDNFKSINQLHDHDVGDFCLQRIADALSELVNSDRVLGRWGGEEFVLITDDLATGQQDEFSQLLLNTIRQTQIKTNKATISLTASVGVSKVHDSSNSAWTRALYQADKALFTAKSRGRDCVVFAATDCQVD